MLFSDFYQDEMSINKINKTLIFSLFRYMLYDKHREINSDPFYIIWEVLLANGR